MTPAEERAWFWRRFKIGATACAILWAAIVGVACWYRIAG